MESPSSIGKRTISPAIFGVNPCLNPNGFINSGAASFTNYTVFPRQTWNQYRGPESFDRDMALYNSFSLRERMNFAVGLNAYNVFNHPNFGLPDAGLADSTGDQITSTVGVPTSP